ncbi:MAG TPA: hypothetical protein PLZ51_28625, partial [Aggregatilineales bacterium]|nr:hypothetical protein [Aggregatilineales bacterium]
QITLIPDIVELSQALLKTYFLKAYDAVQLASALFVHQTIKINNGVGLTFLTSDIKLLTIAKSENIPAIDPQSQT